MSGPILHNSAPILLIGAGPASAKEVTKAFAHVKSVVALDGGLNTARELGVPVDLVVGDFDSSDRPKDMACHHDPDQDTNDLEKALAVVKAPAIIAAGVLGGRLDHHMATFSVMLKTSKPLVVVDDQNIAFLAPPTQSLEIATTSETTAGFYPLIPVVASVEGVKWPLQNAALAPDGLISTSNMATGSVMRVTAQSKGLLVILPLDHLDAVMAALI